VSPGALLIQEAALERGESEDKAASRKELVSSGRAASALNSYEIQQLSSGCSLLPGPPSPAVTNCGSVCG